MQPCLCLCVFQRLCRRDLSVSRRSFARASCVRAHRSVYCAFVRQGVVAASAPGRASVRETGRRAERVGKRGEGGGGCIRRGRCQTDSIDRSVFPTCCRCIDSSKVFPKEFQRVFSKCLQRVSKWCPKRSKRVFLCVSKRARPRCGGCAAELIRLKCGLSRDLSRKPL